MIIWCNIYQIYCLNYVNCEVTWKVMNINKKKGLSILILVLIVFLVACTKEDNSVGEEELRERRMMYRYAMDFMLFNDVAGRIKSALFAIHADSRDNYSGLVFVLNAEDRKAFEEDVLVLWPHERTTVYLDALNRTVIRNEIYLEQFSLEYPIALENIVYDWKQVYDLWFGDDNGGVEEVDRGVILRTRGEWPPIEETTEEFREIRRMSIYSRDFRLRVNDGEVNPLILFGVKDFSSIAFVFHPEEAEDLLEDILALWPSERTETMLVAFNRLIVLEEIDLEGFSLMYPITVENLIEDWEKVYEVWAKPHLGGISFEGRRRIINTNGNWPRDEDMLED